MKSDYNLLFNVLYLLTALKIFSYIAYPIFDIDIHSVRPYSDEDTHTFDYIRRVGRTEPFGYEFRTWPRPGEMQLRLVCRAFNRAMRRASFKHEDTIVRPWKASTVQSMQDFIIDEKSAIAPLATRLSHSSLPTDLQASLPVAVRMDTTTTTRR